MNNIDGTMENVQMAGDRIQPNPIGLKIEQASEQDFKTINHIAHLTWPTTFGEILTPAQIDYMLEMMYSPAALQEQVYQRGHTFLLAREAGQCWGFASYQPHYKGTTLTKIHKIYVLPNTQGKGIGKALIGAVANIARRQGDSALTLNVNRYNPAVQFYQHIGFRIVGEEDIDIGKGFLMEDFIMEKPL